MTAPRGADALVIVTEWDAFRALDLGRLKAGMAAPVVVDLRNIYRPDDMKTRGFSYVSIGRPDNVKPSSPPLPHPGHL
jgi:UDPglucose 6-dehydrogenase